MILVTLALGWGCARREVSAPPPVPVHERGPAMDPALAAAIRAWHEHDDLGPLRAYVRAHPDDDVAARWREVVALHGYDACGHAADPDVDGLRRVVADYPDTMGGRVAALTLAGDGLARLRAHNPSPEVVDFLAGGDAWNRGASGEPRVPADQAAAIHREHVDEIRDAMARVLLADGCRTALGYCTWWVEHETGHASTRAIRHALDSEWYRRGHPPWKSGEHLRCAQRCVRRCRPEAKPLDDGCHAPCFAKC